MYTSLGFFYQNCQFIIIIVIILIFIVIMTAFAAGKTAEEAAEELCNVALKLGSSDNVTAVIVLFIHS